MADFSSSGIPELPPITADLLRGAGDPRVLSWLQEAVQEGDRLVRSDPAYDHIDTGLRYIVGDQRKSATDATLPWIPHLTINQTRKVVQAHVSALTDLKPLFGYKPMNPAYGVHGYLLNKLTVAWWVSTQADLDLGDCVKLALGAGTGDLKIEWDPHAGFGGDHALIASDPRDTLPIRPTQQRSVQLWEGLILREEHTVNVLRAQYPTKAHLFKPSADSLLSTLMGRFRRVVSSLMSPQTDTLSGLQPMSHSTKPKSGQCLLYRLYLTDRTRNLTGKPIPMGDPTSNWAYVVEHGQPLYPRKRLVVATPDAIIYDGPNPYWHGQYPISRLRLWSVPWQFLGLSLIHDLLPMQDGINDLARDLMLGFKQWTDASVVYDRDAVSESFMRLYDPRRPGAKVKQTTPGVEGFKKLDGPPPQVLSLGLQFMGTLLQKFDDLSGTANLQQLLELRQMPGADTIQRYYEALTPELRQEGRMVEAFLREVGEQTKVNTFQFMSSAKRVAILGDAGLTLQDFDYDPDSLVPALTPTDPGYTPELDVTVPRDERAQFFHKQFVFTIAPNSILAMNAQEEKLLNLQLARMGYLDFWTLMETLERANVGQPPPMPLPPLSPPDPAEVIASITQAALGQPGGKYVLDPATGQVMEVRVPQTITERLMAQQLLGIGMTTNPAGRKASAGSPPRTEVKTDETGAPRQTITESSGSRNA